MQGPREFETFLNESEKSIVVFFAETNKYLRICFFATLVLVFWWIRVPLSTMDFRFLHYPNFAREINALFAVICLSFLMPFIPREKRSIFTAYAFLQVLIFINVKNSISTSLLGFLFYPILICMSFIFLRFFKKNTMSLIAYIFFSLIFLLGVVLYDPSLKWLLIKNIHYYITSVVIIHMESERWSTNRYFKYLITPTHLFLPIIYPLEETKTKDENQDDTVWISGFIQIFKALFLLSVLWLIVRCCLGEDGEDIPFHYIWLYYVAYLFLAPVVGNLVTGIAKIYYFDVPDCSNHLWLSSSPLDFLKRENVHAYKFSIRYFYFGFLKITRNPLIIVLFYALLFPFYRDIFDYLYGAYGGLSFRNFSDYFEYKYLYWISFMILIVATFKIKFFTDNRNSWAPIIGLHVLMSITFALLYLNKYL